MKALSKPWFILACLLWLTVFISRRAGYHLAYFNSYLTDLLAVPVLANIALVFQRTCVIRSERYCFKPGHLIFIAIYTSLVFEVFLPQLSRRYTADMTDVLMYGMGAAIFYFRYNKPLQHV